MSCVQATDLPPVRATCEPRTYPVRQREQHALLPRVFFKSHFYSFRVPRMLSVRCPCVARADFVKCPKNRIHLYRASTCSALTTHVVRTDPSSILKLSRRFIALFVFKMPPMKVAKKRQKKHRQTMEKGAGSRAFRHLELPASLDTRINMLGGAGRRRR